MNQFANKSKQDKAKKPGGEMCVEYGGSLGQATNPFLLVGGEEKKAGAVQESSFSQLQTRLNELGIRA